LIFQTADSKVVLAGDAILFRHFLAKSIACILAAHTPYYLTTGKYVLKTQL